MCSTCGCGADKIGSRIDSQPFVSLPLYNKMTMKQLVLLSFFATITFALSSQVYYDKNDFSNYLDTDSMRVKLAYNEYSIEGSYEEVVGRDYSAYYLVNGEGNIHWVLKKYATSKIYGIDILQGDYATVKKEFLKGRKYKNAKVVFTTPSDDSLVLDLISEWEKDYAESEIERKRKLLERKEKEKEKIAQFDSDLVKSGFIGTYEIKIRTHSRIDYSKLESYGKIILTEAGVTIETDIQSISLLRCSYEKGMSAPLKGEFSCRINVGYAETLVLVLDSETNSGAFTTSNGRVNKTTTFTIRKL